MKAFLKRLGRRLRDFFAAFISALSTIVVLASILTILGLSTTVYGYLQQLNALILTGVTVTIISVIILVVLYTVLEPLFREASVESSRQFDFEVLEKHISYRYFEDGQKMEALRLYKVRALQDGLSKFTDKYTWTGAGKCDLSVLEPGHTISSIRRIANWTFFDVVFPKLIRKGEVTQFTIFWDMYDEQKTAVPFLSTAVDRPTRKITMRVILPRSQKPKDVLIFDYPDTVTYIPVNVIQGVYDEFAGEIRHEVQEPKYQHKYLISWSP